MDSKKPLYMLVGIAAAVAASAATYYVLSRGRQVVAKAESVQELLDRCHDQVKNIESRLGELSAA